MIEEALSSLLRHKGYKDVAEHAQIWRQNLWRTRCLARLWMLRPSGEHVDAPAALRRVSYSGVADTLTT
jgi:hypothetical protein